MLLQHMDAKLYARALLDEIPEVPHAQGLRDIACAPDGTSSDPESLQSVVEGAAALFLCPEQTIRVARVMGPLLLDVVARALSAARAAGASEPGARLEGRSAAVLEPTGSSQAETIFVAMSRLLPSAPQALPLALQHWRSTPCPFDFLTSASTLCAGGRSPSPSPGTTAAPSASSSAPATRYTADAERASPAPVADYTAETEASQRLLRRVHAVAEASHKLLSWAPLRSSLRDLWNWAPFFELCRHQDALVRWRAVGICSSLLGVDEQGRRSFLAAAEASCSASSSSKLQPQTAKPGDTLSRSSHIDAPLAPPGGTSGSASTAAGGSAGGSAAAMIANAELDLLDHARDAPSLLNAYPRVGLEGRAEDTDVSDRRRPSADGDGTGPSPAFGAEPSTSSIGSAATAQPFAYRPHPAVADIGGILHPKMKLPRCAAGSCNISRESTSPGVIRRRRRDVVAHERFVPTPSATKNLYNLSLAMAVDRPILLHGPAGSGKSLLVREAARLASDTDGDSVPGDASSTPSSLLELHLDDQTDSKTLLGAHACSDIPGEFAWQPGALTRAAVAGTWVLIEDLERAPFEVLAALGPLLEGRPLMLPGRMKPLRPAPGFRIFGTVTTTGPGRVVLGGPADFGALWTHVPVEGLSTDETLDVARVRFCTLPSPALRRMLNTLVAAKGSDTSSRRGSGFASRSSAGRELGVRDFFKLCARVEVSKVFDHSDSGQEAGLAVDEERWFCSEAQALPVVLDSVDIFAGHVTTTEALTNAAEMIAGMWNVLPSRVIELATISRPELVQDGQYLKIGRVTLAHSATATTDRRPSSFAPTSHALRLMESVAAAVQACEPTLLVGETGCGKTALVQRLAEGTGRHVVVQNLSLQTDGADLIGGFRPVELRQLAQGVVEKFLQLFPLLFSASQNVRFCQAITSSFERRQWKKLSAGLKSAAKMALDKLDRSRSERDPRDSPGRDHRADSSSSNKTLRSATAGGSASPSGQRRDWESFSEEVERFEHQRAAVDGSFAFSFVEGVLIKAIREGKWILLDEINLASAETLQRLSGLLEGVDGSLCLTERGDVEPIARHPDFRLFAAMNPPTDASKKDLPPALRRRFTEVYVPELNDRSDLKRVADGYLSGISLEQEHLALTAVDLYMWARELASESLSDGAGQRPRYSLRTLVGGLSAARRLVDRGFNPRRAMIEGFRGAFETQLDGDGRVKMVKGILKAFGKGMSAKDLEKPPRRPGGRSSSTAPWVRIGPFWLEGGPLQPVDSAQLDATTKQRKFVLTPTVEGTLRCLARAVASTDSAVLLQGPTSAGKTSIVEYLAARLGHRCVRINNHEHTDIQEYTGSYAADGNGRLAFQEGILVESLRRGYWVILDELNLAPSEVLEALNRLLDHNRELFLPETQEIIKPHVNFRLFATQNPPGAYGGRKPLSRAFRNRFMEIHVDDIPGVEWEVILAERCSMPPSYCKLLVKILHELQAQRQCSRLFLGKNSAISRRDLLRWAGRKPQGKQELLHEGYMLLAERLRSEDEKRAMKNVLEKQIGVSLDPGTLYDAPTRNESTRALDAGNGHAPAGEVFPVVDERDLGSLEQLRTVQAMLHRGDGLEAGLDGVAMTRHMRRLFRLSGRCLSHQEPLLLVGETGCGKTTVCQLYSMLLSRKMHTVNCHQNTEAGDLLGGLRPLRGREGLLKNLQDRATDFLRRCRALELASRGSHNSVSAEGAKVLDSDMSGLSASSVMANVQVACAIAERALTGGTDSTSSHTSPSSHADEHHTKRVRPPEKGEAPGGVGNTQGGDDGPATAPKPQLSSRPRGNDPSTAGSKKRRGKRRRTATEVIEAPDTTHEIDSPRDAVTTSPSAAGVYGEDSSETLAELQAELGHLRALAARTRKLFEWVDGPLVTAMRNGELILLDELSLADDAVLERLNSVLEPGRSITLPEKGTGGAAAEEIVAAPGFRVMATMNPGGDFGKRELSPALRSRFTEVWVPALSAREDMEGVVRKAFDAQGNLLSIAEDMARNIMDFASWFNNSAASSVGGARQLLLSVRDLLAWAHFITCSLTGDTKATSSGSEHALRPWEAYIHGAALVLLDGLGLGAGMSPASVARLKSSCADVLARQVPESPERDSALAQLGKDVGTASHGSTALSFEIRRSTAGMSAEDCSGRPSFGVEPFFTPCGPGEALGPNSGELDFSVTAPTTAKNLYRVLRALQVPKAVLLEGSPGVGKTSLISALAAASGHELVRINLSEQTDISDLFGSDLPVPDATSDPTTPLSKENGWDDSCGGTAGNNTKFSWCDGVFLRALKAGKWVLLDELNLATQSVLEGLNACLDHRAEVFVPEIGQSFHCPSTFKIFAAQNPLSQGGGRKGLPRSFLSRFTKVYVDPLTTEDLLFIASNKFPVLTRKVQASETREPAQACPSMLARMIAFNSLVQQDTMELSRYGRTGSPWEFNLRDVFRWCDLLLREQGAPEACTAASECVRWQPWLMADTLYLQRMRTHGDRSALLSRFVEAFPEAFEEDSGESKADLIRRKLEMIVEVKVTPKWLQVGETVIPRGCWTETASPFSNVVDELRSGLPMSPALNRPMQALARCVAMSWPALVIGERGTGKSFLIRGLAAAVGASLTEVAMSPALDVTELLGCFEQADAYAEQEELMDVLHDLVVRTVRVMLESREGWAGVTSRSVWTAWCALRRCYGQPMSARTREAGYAQEQGLNSQGPTALNNLLAELNESIRKLENSLSEGEGIFLLEESTACAVSREHMLKRLSKRAQQARSLANKVLSLPFRPLMAGDERAPPRKKKRSSIRWRDGVLVEALTQGHWLVLDGANLCSASVLDRLNSLLEPAGVLLLTESGVVRDNVSNASSKSPVGSGHRVIRPHPNFRLFLTADPGCGEVSRAMRNRCVEICLLRQPAEAARTSQEGTPCPPRSHPGPISSWNRGRIMDSLAVLRASGLADPKLVSAALSMHSYAGNNPRLGDRRGRGDPSFRSLGLCAELVAAAHTSLDTQWAGCGVSSAVAMEHKSLESCMRLVYDGAAREVGLGTHADTHYNVLRTCLCSSPEAVRSLGTCNLLASGGWRENVLQSTAATVQQEFKVLQVAQLLTRKHESRSMLADDVARLLHMSTEQESIMAKGDEDLFFEAPLFQEDDHQQSLREKIRLYAIVHFCRRTSCVDRHLRCAITSRWATHFAEGTDVEESLAAVMNEVLFSPLSVEVINTFSDVASQLHAYLDGTGVAGSKEEAAVAAVSRDSPCDPRAGPERLSRCLSSTSSRLSSKLEPCLLLMRMRDLLVSRRLPVTLREAAEVREARHRVASGRLGEDGLGWLGVSCVINEGRSDAPRTVWRGRDAAHETRLARLRLAPYLLPLLRSVDSLMSVIVCREVVQVLTVEGPEVTATLLVTLRTVLRNRDIISELLRAPCAGVPGPDASGGGGAELAFPWDSFLIAWRWMLQAVETMRAQVSAFHEGVFSSVAAALASLRATSARVDAAVLEHAGGTLAAEDLLWAKGEKATAARTAHGATALCSLNKLADGCSLFDADISVNDCAKARLISLEILMRQAHPSLSCSLESREEILHALSILHWAVSGEQVADTEDERLPRYRDLPRSTSGGTHGRERPITGALAPSALDTDAMLLSRDLPAALEINLKSEQEQFKDLYRGTKIEGFEDGGSGRDDELHAFDGDPVEAGPQSTILVLAADNTAVTDGADGTAGRRSVGSTRSADNATSRGGVLNDFAAVQLCPLREHWIMVEECDILERLSSLAVVNGGEGLESALARIMSRVSRLCSCIIATRSTSPRIARPYQTLLWVWENPDVRRNTFFRVLTKLLPVALESWGERLWRSIFSNPSLVSLRLSPPPLLSMEHRDKMSGGTRKSDLASMGTSFERGPMQLLSLSRTSLLLHLVSTSSFRRGVLPCAIGQTRGHKGNVDLTVMNSSARRQQFRLVLQSIRDLRYCERSPLDSLACLAWSRIRRTLAVFHDCGDPASGSSEEPLFGTTAEATLEEILARAVSDASCGGDNWDSITGALRQFLNTSDEGFRRRVDALVVPCTRALARAVSAVGGSRESSTRPSLSDLGLGIALLGHLRFLLLLPSSPVDPGIKPTLMKNLLEGSVDDMRADLTVRRWSVVLNARRGISPEMVPLMREAHSLRDECARLDRESIERPDNRPPFHILFREVHAFARGVGDASRFKTMVEALACAARGGGTVRHAGHTEASLRNAALVQEEEVWQSAAGAFVQRLREQYSVYVDVVTGLCDAIELSRLGLRLLAAEVRKIHSHTKFSCDAVGVLTGRGGSVAQLQRVLLEFPYTCSVGNDAQRDALGEQLRAAIEDHVPGSADMAAFGAQQRMSVLRAALSRAELLLKSGCSGEASLNVAAGCMAAAVGAWSRQQAEDEDRKRKEDEILKYKMQEHKVESEEAKNVASMRALFPDYHETFRDLDPGAASGEGNGAGTVEPIEENAARGVSDAGVHLGRLTNEQLSSFVVSHSRIFMELAARRRNLLHHLHLRVAASTPINEDIARTSVLGRASYADRVAAFGDSYRASVLLADITAELRAHEVVGVRGADTVEEAFSASHMMALANASSVCESGKGLLEAGAKSSPPPAQFDVGIQSRAGRNKFDIGGATGILVESLSLAEAGTDCPPGEPNFYADPDVSETRLADKPLSGMLRRVATLLEEFPGHGVLIQLARVVDRVRRMPLHSPLAAVLAGVELALRKAQDWEQHAHRGVSLKEELGDLSALVVRWRKAELRSWPRLLDERERSFALKGNKWWLHLYRLINGDWAPDKENATSSFAKASKDSGGDEGVHTASSACAAIDWPSARTLLPNWLWSELLPKSPPTRLSREGDTGQHGIGAFSSTALEHARGLFSSLDEFIRTSSVGEFFVRLQMLRSFSAQLVVTASAAPADGPILADGKKRPSGRRESSQALWRVLHGLWAYYTQFSEEVLSTRNLVRDGIEKKLKEEAKLAKWDDQTYYSLAESSEKSHRKLTKLVKQYDEVLEVSVSEVLRRSLIGGIGEREEGCMGHGTGPCTEIPSLASMFPGVTKVDCAADLIVSDRQKDLEDESADGALKSHARGGRLSARGGKAASDSRQGSFPQTSLQLLDASVPLEPPDWHAKGARDSVSSTLADKCPSWVRSALLAQTGAKSTAAAVDANVALITRMRPLARRMRSLLRRRILSTRKSGTWAEGGRPDGFAGAGLTEELCTAVFSRIHSLRAKGVGKQVKKRAVVDLLAGMREQGLSYTRSATPAETANMLNIMALPQPCSTDHLVGSSEVWLCSGSPVREEGFMKSDFIAKADRYYRKGLSELSRLRLEAGAPISGDITRREAEVMRGLSEHLGLLVLQQRGATSALEADVMGLAREVRAILSLADDFAPTESVRPPSLDGRSDPTLSRDDIPPQCSLRNAVETQRNGLLQLVESVQEILLLVGAVSNADPPSSSSVMNPVSEGAAWGNSTVTARQYASLTAAVKEVEETAISMLARLDRFPILHAEGLPGTVCSEGRACPAIALLPASALGTVRDSQQGLRALADLAANLADEYAFVIPPTPLRRVGLHAKTVVNAVEALFASKANGSSGAGRVASGVSDDSAERRSAGGAEDCKSRAVLHASKIGELIEGATKTLLLSVQALSLNRDGAEEMRPHSNAREATSRDHIEEIIPAGEEHGSWASPTDTLMQAHKTAFEQAKSLKLWRCSSSLASARRALESFAEDQALSDPAIRGVVGAAARDLFRELAELAQHVFTASRAVLVGLLVLNKGTAKLHYVVMRVFRTLLSKGFCADEVEEQEGEGDGNVDGLKFDDDVEGTGMGEGEGKKDVTDQIEDEEQLLGLKGDDPEQTEQDQARESKELGEDDKDKGMEMDNNFDGEMFDVPEGQEKNDEPEEDDEREELDREMGDLGDNADVVDEKLWDDDQDGEDDEDGKDQGEKFEEGSRLDGEKPVEDEIRTKDDTGQENDDGQAKDEGEEPKKPVDEAVNNEDEGGPEEERDLDQQKEGHDGEGPVNDDLQDNYEDKPVGVDVRGEDDAMEVEEEGKESGAHGDDADNNDEDQDLPDQLNLDDDVGDDQVDEDGEQGDTTEVADEDGGEGDKEGFDSMAPEDEAEDGDELVEHDEQPQGSGNPGAPDLDSMDKEESDTQSEEKNVESEEKLAEDAQENKDVANDAPPAFGVEGKDANSMEAAEDQGQIPEDSEKREGGEADDASHQQHGGAAAPDGAATGGVGQGDEGDGGEWKAGVLGGDGQGQRQEHERRRRPEVPNPFRDPGDAMRHWHRRLDMLRDERKLHADEKHENGDDAGNDDTVGDDTGDDDGDGKFEYVTAKEKESSQVLGGVSEDQAAMQEADPRDEKDEIVKDGEGCGEGSMADAMDEDTKGSDMSANDPEDREHGDLDRGEQEDAVDTARRSGKKRASRGYRADDDDEEEIEGPPQDEILPLEEEMRTLAMDVDDLEDDLARDAMPSAEIMTNPHLEENESIEDIRPHADAPDERLRERLHALAEDLQRRKHAQGDGVDDIDTLEDSRQVWGRLRGVTSGLSQRLCEQLRLVLEPLVATKLQGDYRMGKRINMRRVIPYIASGFRKDKIWLKRTKPAKRDYQILVAIDDSESMADCGAGALALAAMTTVASGLTQLEAGQLAVARFGETLDLLHGFGDAFSEEAGAKIVAGFSFRQPRTNTANTLDGVVSLLEEARNSFSMSRGSVASRGVPRQLVLLLSDGRFDRENKERLRKLVREMNERGQLLVLIVLDKEGDTSILKTREANYVDGKLVLSNYLDKYPFPLYILLNHVEALPETLADALKQWFELLQMQSSAS